MKTNTEKILAVMHILAWVTFVGLIIQAGAILVSYSVSLANPEAAKNLYKGLNMYGLRQYNVWHYTATVLCMVALALLEAYTAWLVVKLLAAIKLASPFTLPVANMLRRISYYILSTWVTAMLYDAYTGWLSKTVAGLKENVVSGEFIFLAGVVFVIAQIFKKGVEIQAENDLTV